MTIVLQDIDNSVATLTLNLPAKRNALSDEMLESLADAIEAAVAQPAIRAIVIAGAEGCFVAGADINRFNKFDAVTVRDDARPFQWERIARCPKPLIAAVEGWCLGAGCELALHCDIVIASDTAVFGLPEVGLGIIPGAGGTQRLPRSLSKTDAMLMVLTGSRFEAERALSMGLVSEVTPGGEALARAAAIADTIAQRAPIAVENAKRAVNAAYETGLTQGLSTERDLYRDAFATRDRAEGVVSFLEKRRPNFDRS